MWNQVLIKFIYMLKIPIKQNIIFLIDKRISTGLKHFNDCKSFIRNSNDVDDNCRNIEEYNQNKKRKILIIFDDMIVDILSNKKLNPVLTELFIRGRKLKISYVLLYNLILVFQKILDQILCTILL